MGRRRHDDDEDDEPSTDGDDWIEWGGELVFAVDFTPGGAPIGLTREEWRAENLRYRARRGWARAYAVLETTLRKAAPDAELDIGRVRKRGEGLSRDSYGAYVELTPDPGELSDLYIVRLPRPDADDDLQARTYREAELLWRLAELELPFRIPQVLSVVPERHGPAMVQRAVEGLELDRDGAPWKVVGPVAAQVHAIEVDRVRDLVAEVHGSARAHVLSELSELEGDASPELRDAAAWAAAHAPGEDVPARLLHGDLLPQNIHASPPDPPSVIDWEYAKVGDPAYDLAIVTRGVRRPFKVERGLEKLVDAYRNAGGAPSVSPQAVQVHELCMLGAWYRGELEDTTRRPTGQPLNRLRALLKRLRPSV